MPGCPRPLAMNRGSGAASFAVIACADARAAADSHRSAHRRQDATFAVHDLEMAVHGRSAVAMQVNVRREHDRATATRNVKRILRLASSVLVLMLVRFTIVVLQ